MCVSRSGRVRKVGGGVKISEGGNDGIDIVRTSSGRESDQEGTPKGQGERETKRQEGKKGVWLHFGGSSGIIRRSTIVL